jgi:hypothetical protein
MLIIYLFRLYTFINAFWCSPSFSLTLTFELSVPTVKAPSTPGEERIKNDQGHAFNEDIVRIKKRLFDTHAIF